MLASVAIQCQDVPVWISELSQRSRLPVATVKFYLREGLLPPGEAVGATRAHYDESHLRRLRLIRALVEMAGLRLEEVRSILAAVDDDSLPMHEVVGSAHSRLSESSDAPSASAASRSRVEALVRRRRWRIAPDSAHKEALARALDALDVLEYPVTDDLLDGYAAALATTAEREVGALADSSAEQATEMAVVGTLLLEPVVLVIRRMAQESVSAQKLHRSTRPRTTTSTRN
jgi:DNA-binding transcriptional MerR regulator